MAFTDYKSAVKAVKSGSFQTLYFIYGDENHYKKSVVDLICESAVEPSFRDFNYHFIEGQDSDLDEIAQSALSVPFMSDYNVTVVHDFTKESFGINPRQKKDSDKTDEDNSTAAEDENSVKSSLKKTEHLLQSVPETSILIFWQDSVPTKDGWTPIIKLMGKYACCIECKALKGDSLSSEVEAFFKSRKIKITKDVKDYLIEVVGTDLNTLFNECEKLCLFTDGDEITKEVIDLVCSRSSEAKIYDFTDSLIYGNYRKAYFDLDTLCRQKEDLLKTMGSVIGIYVDLYRIKLALNRGLNEDDFKKSLSSVPEWKIKRFISVAQKLSYSYLRRVFEILADADADIKLNYGDEKIRSIIEKTIAKIASLPKR